MKKILMMFFLALIAINISSAANLEVKKVHEQNIIITELDNNATFTLSVKNEEPVTDNFQIYSLVGVSIYPREMFQIKPGETKEIEITVVPHRETIRDWKGKTYAFEYQIKGQKTGFFKEALAIKILGVKDAVEVLADSIRINATEVKLKVKNNENFNFENIKINGKSEFFEFSETFNLGSKEQKEIAVPIAVDKKVEAGEYDIELTYEFNNIKSTSTSSVKYLEFGGLSVSESSEGFIVRKNAITKTNEGNVPTKATIGMEKNILTRLLTIYSIKPDSAERSGLVVDYLWEKNLNPGESFTVVSTTNYTMPFIFIVIIVLVGAITKFAMSKKLGIQKRVSLVKTKGGELALKVFLRVKARKDAHNVLITDRLPHMVQLYEKFGMHAPKVDHSNRKLEWHIPHLSSGEERVLTYIIYSKINVVGSFELPAASASYEIEGKREFAFSNKTHFAAETTER